MAAFFHAIYTAFDAFAIFWFRIPSTPIIGYFLGTSVLALLCVVLGDAAGAASRAANRRRMEKENETLSRMYELSTRAAAAGDRDAYRALNREGNDAFGRVFFTQTAVGISTLFPVPFALAWMETRFSAVEFSLPVSLPGIGDTVGYPFTFIPLYILVRIVYGRLRRRIITAGRTPAGSGDQCTSTA
jgi:hypothetical protein